MHFHMSSIPDEKPAEVSQRKQSCSPAVSASYLNGKKVSVEVLRFWQSHHLSLATMQELQVIQYQSGEKKPKSYK